MIEAGSEINSSFIRSELIDEFVFDRDIESKKQHGLAYSFRFVYNPFIMEKDIFTLFTSIMHVGSPTFRHYKGSNNFVAGGQPLGWINGSDSRDLSIGINYLKSEKILMSISTGYFQAGDESVINRPYDSYVNYNKSKFPSGSAYDFIYFDSFFRYFINSYSSVTLGLNYSFENFNYDTMVELDIYYPF